MRSRMNKSTKLRRIIGRSLDKRLPHYKYTPEPNFENNSLLKLHSNIIDF